MNSMGLFYQLLYLMNILISHRNLLNNTKRYQVIPANNA